MSKTHSFGARAVLTLVSLQLALGPQFALAQTAPVTVAPAPADALTSTTTSANGTPVVNIATPNAAGVSHNRFNSYDVSSTGLILNNSASNAVSLLGGGVAGNSNLANSASANLILNEVIAPNAGSTLSGYQEVLGQSAEIVLANPWGITCNGCGFINTPRVTLTTGTPRLAPGGALAGFTITGGQIAIVGEGLDATRQQTLDILARGISVSGNVIVGSSANSISGDLQLLGGSNEFNYATRSGTAIAGSGAAPTFALDSSALGGMYADRIRLVVNEHGAGVRLAGNVAALAEDLTIGADGRIELRGAASAARDLNIRGGDIQVQLANADTYLYGGRDLAFTSSGTLALGNGSIGAQRSLSLSSVSLFDTGGSNDLRFTGDTGTLSATASGDLDLSGGYWTAPQLSFSGANVRFGAGTVAYGRASTGSTFDITASGLLSVQGGQLYSNADATLGAQRLETDSNAVVAATGALNVTVGKGSTGGADNAGVLQGASVSVLASGDASSSATTIQNSATGQIFATNALAIGETGTPSTAGSDLVNRGTIVGDAVTIDTTRTTNFNAIQASTQLNLNSAAVQNSGKDSRIIGSTSPTGAVTLATDTLINEGTIWSAGDLTLNPASLVQQRAADATANPLIGAGRDLTIAHRGDAYLLTGDLQAGRDLTITADTLTDIGGTGAGGTTGDLRSAGRNLSVTATGDAVIAGGQWYSAGNLDIAGESLTFGRYYDPFQGTYRFTSGLQVIGAQSGTAAINLTARSGSVDLASDAGIFSGGDLNITQQTGFILPQYTVLQADGTLSIGARSFIDNYGKIFGGTLSLGSSDGLAFDYTNRATGVLYGTEAIRIGSPSARAGFIGTLASAPGAQAGIYGGVLDLHATHIINNGTIQGVGAGSLLSATTVTNHAGAVIQGFADTEGFGSLRINASSIANLGTLFDSSNLALNTANLSNAEGASIGSSGLLEITAGGGVGAQPVHNLGTIGGRDVDLRFGSGLVNGLDPGVPVNRGNRASIFASRYLGIGMLNGATLTNYSTIESDQDLSISYGNGGTLSNQMSMIPDSELVWTPGLDTPTVTHGDYGLLTTGQNGSSDKHHRTIDGTEYYYFGGDTQTSAYLDRQTTRVENQAFASGVNPASIPTPTIRAGGNLSITGFGQVLNNGTIEAVQDATIRSSAPGSSLQNTALYFGQRDQNSYVVEGYTCRRETTVAGSTSTIDWGCGVTFPAGPNEARYDGFYGGYTPSTTYTGLRQGNVAFAGRIFAGGTLDVGASTVVNSGAPQQFQVPTPTGPVQSGTISVSAPGTPGSRAGATTLTLNGAQIPLPTSSSGRFVTGTTSSTTPLIESNPIFGIDSVALGSDYLANLLGLQPEQQARRLGDDNYEAYLIQQQVKAQTGRSVLETAWNTGDMVQTLFDNAATEAQALGLGYGKALTSGQIASLKSDIVWMVEQEVQGQKVLVPVVYLTDATRARADTGNGPTLAGYNVNIDADSVTNKGAQIVAANGLAITTTGNIENLSGRIAGWNVRLDAGGDLVNSTLVSRVGDAQNGHDVAQRVATIEAGETAILKAGRDINVNGAWVAAAKDAVLIAGQNVNVNALALTANTKTGDSRNGTTTQEQTALGAGIVAGGNAVLKGGQDVNIKGADVAAGGVAALHAENGNVNIGVLELTNSQTTTKSSTGLYTQLDTNKKNASATLGIGVETKTTTETTTTTVGVGSRISGNGVAISTGKGDVNITGSSIETGKEGAFIDSARDVNISAYNDRTETSSSTDRTRAGYQLDASADEVLGGAAQSGKTVTTTTTDTTARISTIKSGGNVIIRGQGTVTNEGTAIEAAEGVALLADNIVNKAARNTSTTTTTESNWETKQQSGLTTNGTGASINNAAQGNGNQVSVNNLELQQRLTASYSTQTDTTSTSQAVGTQIKAGGNVVVNARKSASDEGTQYNAGKDIIISAEDYTNSAAADTTTTTSERTYGSGRLSVGVNSSVEVAINASGEGGQTSSTQGQSTARTGTLDADGKVIIQARSGDVTLEGTQISGKEGVGISAARDININQANDTTTSSSSENSGSGRVSGSVSLIGAGGSVGAGASTRVADSTETSSKAKVASIASANGNVQLDAGRDLTAQGTNIAAGGDVSLTAKRDVNLLAATDRTDKTGSVEAGGADVNVGFGTGAAKGSGGVSASVDFEKGKTDYHEQTERGGTITAGGKLTVDAGRDARLQGTQVDAGTADLKTGGNLTLESAKHTVTDNSYNVSGHVEASASKGGGVGGASTVGQGSSGTSGGKGGNAGGGNAQVNVAKSKQDIETNTNATINTRGGTNVNVGGDMSLKGANVNAQGGVTGQVAGNLTIETRTDKTVVDQTDVKAYGGVAPVGGTGGGSKFQRGQEGVQAATNHAGQTGGFTDVDVQKKDNLTVGTASGISGGQGGIDVRVGGNTTLKGATNAGTDFKTEGQTTIESVETRTDESATKFRVAGTAASAAGSDKGKGGDFNASLNLPGSRGDSPNTVKRPGADNDSNQAPPPAARPRPDSNAPGTVARPQGDAPRTQPGAPDPVRRNSEPPSNDNYANNPNGGVPTAPIARPRASSEPANLPPVRPVTPGNEPTAPLANNYGNAPGDGAPNAPVVRPRASSDPGAPGAQRGVANDRQPQNRNVPANDAPDRLAMVRPAENNAAPNAAPNAPPPAPARQEAPNPPGGRAPEWAETIDSDPRARTLRTVDGGLDSIERQDFERNLAEIVAFKNDARHADQADRLLTSLQDSLAGPQERNGFKEFPLRPQYVGENETGFDSWKTRKPNEPVGSAYQKDATPQKVRYFTAEEQERNRVYAGPDGKLTHGNIPLAAGNWMFVVDQQGRMIAVPFPRPEDLTHHSSLTGGKPVRMAGKFRIDPLGRISRIENESGHFRPDQQSFERFLVDLKANGINLIAASAPAYSYTATENNQYRKREDHQDLMTEQRIQNGAPNGMLASMTVQKTLSQSMQQPQIAALQRKGDRFGTDDRKQFERNLQEIVAFTNETEYAAHRPQLLAAMDQSLKGPQDRGDGLKLFPLQPRYVGENVQGFDNWNTRGRAERGGVPKVPGERYADQRHLPSDRRELPQPIVYYSVEQQQKAQVFVENGQLAFANGKLADGDWIFVVDKNGRMIASRAEDGRVHHSSLSGGEPVLMAGELKISGGKLSTITNKSGHFRPDPDAFQQFLGEIKGQHVALEGVSTPAFRGFTPSDANGNLRNGSAPDAPGRQMLAGLQPPPGANTRAAPVAHPVPELQAAPNAIPPAPNGAPVVGPGVIQPAVQPVRPPETGAKPRRGRPVRPSPRPANPEDAGLYQGASAPDAPAQPPANGADPPTTWWVPAAPAESAWHLPLAA